MSDPFSLATNMNKLLCEYECPKVVDPVTIPCGISLCSFYLKEFKDHKTFEKCSGKLLEEKIIKG